MLRFFLLADVIANAFLWQILLPLFCGCCYTTCVYSILSLDCVLADVIAIYVEDGKPHFLCLNYWQMLLPCWQMEWPPRVGDNWQML